MTFLQILLYQLVTDTILLIILTPSIKSYIKSKDYPIENKYYPPVVKMFGNMIHNFKDRLYIPISIMLIFDIFISLLINIFI